MAVRMPGQAWVVVANSSRARIFEVTKRKPDDWKLLQELTHDESRLHDGDLKQQRDNPNAGTLHGPPSEIDPGARNDLEAERFARELSDWLAVGADRSSYEGLIIAAPPMFLGKLRKLLPKRVQSRLVKDIGADFTHERADSLVERIDTLR